MDLVEYLRKESGGVEKIDLMQLVTHNDFVHGDVRLDQVYELFKENQRDYMAVIDEGVLLGLCSKTDVSFVLGSRFGFAVMGKKPIRDYLMGVPVCLIRGHSIRDALARVLSRTDKRFYEDVILADTDGSYLGIIPVPHLVHLQTALMNEKYLEMEENISLLESSKKQNIQLFENQAIGIVFLDSQGAVIKGNSKIKEMLGYSSADSLTGVIFSDWIIESDQGRYQRYLKETLNHQEEFFLQSQEFEFSLKNQEVRFFRIQFGHIHENRDPCLFVFDVSEQHEMEKAMISREKNAAVESLVCGIAHEINNKLSPIMGISELMLMNCQKFSNRDSEFKEQLHTIYDTSKEASIMIRQLQQLSRPVNLVFEECHLKEIIENSIKMLRHSLAQNEVFYTIDIPAEKIVVRVDPSQMKQVFLNLILNSIHALRSKKQKKLQIQVALQKHKASILIIDNGEGIPEALKNKIFEPFFTTKQTFEGTGLGLSVCQSIVQNHDGILSMTSEAGQGSTFSVTLPLVLESTLPVHSIAINDNLLRFGDMDFFQESKILIVDDESDICQLIVSAFKGVREVVVMSADSQEKAVDYLKMYDFDWIVSDLRMPFYSGLDLYQWISSNKPQLKNKFVMITGESEQSPLSRSIEELDIPVIRKPFSILKLIEAMKSLQRDLSSSLR